MRATDLDAKVDPTVGVGRRNERRLELSWVIGAKPSAARAARSSGLRQVAITVQPRAAMVRAASRPMPDEQPVIRTVGTRDRSRARARTMAVAREQGTPARGRQAGLSSEAFITPDWSAASSITANAAAGT